MIARRWTAYATEVNATQYATYFFENVMPTLRNISGFRDAELLLKTTNRDVEIIVTTFWNSMESIAAFASPNLESAVVEPAAASILSSWHDAVTHINMRVDKPFGPI